ncbi:urea ABC transporter permease subunit UrtC, partial [Klebsiella pneumoniae]
MGHAAFRLGDGAGGAGSRSAGVYVFLSWSELPWFWWGTQHFAWAMALVVLVPGL